MTIDPTLWGWPQYAMAILMLLALFGACLNHGKSWGIYSAPGYLLETLISFAILWAGGFWS